MKEIAIIGPTASGKTSLSIRLAQKHNAVVLSLDSLCIYKEINIASAKPLLAERGGIIHFGIDEIYPNDNFNVVVFFDLYKKAKKFAKNNKKNLIIVGGTGFYLKSMLTGLSKKEKINKKLREKINKNLQCLQNAYSLISKKDEVFAKKVSSNDKYRIEKWLEIYFLTKKTPSQYLKNNTEKPIIKNIPIFEILVEKEILKSQITKRTNEMIKDNLIDEVFYLESKYSRLPSCMNAIGIKEALEYLDGKINFINMKEKIILNTSRLAKRQMTFNKTQFSQPIFQESLISIEEKIDEEFKKST